MADKRKRMKQYFVWDDRDNDDPDSHDWGVYNSIEDCVDEFGDGVQVFEAKLKPIGKYQKKVSVIKMK